ncbi:MAG: TPM domain-containing protein [Spirochaetes bacterium]|nr:TPM domain-containing protein [Spirochaetota bacterium]
MKKRSILFLFFLVVFANFGYTQDFLKVKPKGYVNDLANVLSSENVNSMELLLTKLERVSGIEIAVVTLPSIGDYTIEQAAVELFEKWGIGKKGKDNGLLFILAKNERKIRIEVGYGLEEAMTDGMAGRLLDTYGIPYLKENNYDQGIYLTTMAIVTTLTKYYNLNIEDVKNFDLKPKKSKSSRAWIIFKFILFFLIFSGFGGRFFPFLFFPGFFGGGSSSGSSGGFGSGGGSFGGFGGGFSGGGGASRGF